MRKDICPHCYNKTPVVAGISKEVTLEHVGTDYDDDDKPRYSLYRCPRCKRIWRFTKV